MKRSVFIIWGLLLVVVVAMIALTVALTPQETDPAYAAALEFASAAGRGDEDAAFFLLTEQMKTYVRENCPGGQVTACVEGYIPDEWGAFQNVVFRRAAPDREMLSDAGIVAYDVELIATYAEGIGFSGVCLYQRMERDNVGTWRVAGYAGFISCGDSASRTMAANPDAPNRAP